MGSLDSSTGLLPHARCEDEAALEICDWTFCTRMNPSPQIPQFVVALVGFFLPKDNDEWPWSGTLALKTARDAIISARPADTAAPD